MVSAATHQVSLLKRHGSHSPGQYILHDPSSLLQIQHNLTISPKQWGKIVLLAFCKIVNNAFLSYFCVCDNTALLQESYDKNLCVQESYTFLNGHFWALLPLHLSGRAKKLCLPQKYAIELYSFLFYFFFGVNTI